MRLEKFACIAVLALALVGCAAEEPVDSATDSPAPDACSSFAEEMLAMEYNVGEYVTDEREGNGEMLQEFLAQMDSHALSAENDEVKARMFTVVEEFPTAGAIMRGYGTDFEPFVEQYNAVARACTAAGSPIDTYPTD